ncbi:hypothetical protein [Sphaerisporangium sp. TRM90804]|uniref:hypothetical protein n=1 Tax=Sphaerisporangium sp. TRM90804 TaxID=3031113 RepID=UPI002447BECD|nr:hypothetical protein [Sphaerisporangium sp. TRM90804]MDH2424961.1 hypothetical protein [Sphaerisporangium sp. TRM90804]
MSQPVAAAPSAGRHTAAITGLGVVADVAAVAQLLTSRPLMGVLFTGLLAALIGLGGLVRHFGKPVGATAVVMATLIAVGSATAGAALGRLWDAPATATAGSATSGPSTTDPSTTDPPTTGPSTAGPSASATEDGHTPAPTSSRSPSDSARPTPKASSGDVVNTGEAILVDRDYLDLESGVISEVSQTADIVYDATYTDMWGKGGGELHLTPHPGTPTLDSCAEHLARRHYSSIDIKLDEWFCLETTENNIGAAKATALPADDSVTLTYTVWKR